METVAKRLYEGMFLVDSAQAAADWEGTLSVLNNILQRADAEIVSMRKWQERKLAYDIDHKTRGTYILCYFNVSGDRIAGIEKDVLLSEKVIRVLVLGTEKRPAEMIEADIKGEAEEKPSPAPAAPPAAAPAAPSVSDEAPAEAGAPAVAETPAPAPEAPVSEPAVEPAEAVEPETPSEETSAPVGAETGQVEAEPDNEGTEKAAE